jgi:hypothetical protein
VATITLVFTQLATGALIATGIPPKVAAFQARSAFSGAGFTTTETENVVNHPVRRRIIMVAMFVGALGTPTLVVTVLVGLVAPGPGNTTVRSLVALSGMLLLLITVLNRPAKNALERLGRHYAQARLLPAVRGTGQELLALDDEFVVAAAEIDDGADDKMPRSLRGVSNALPDVTVLGVHRADKLIALSPVDISLLAGDELVVFGRRANLRKLGLLDSDSS